MKEYLIIDLLESVISGEWGNEPSGEQDVFVLRTTNFSNNGKIDFSKEVVKRNIDEKKVDSKKLNYGDIIIEKSGGSIDQPVGRVVFYDLRDNTTAYLCNNFTSVLRPNTKLVNPKFLFYFLFYLYKCKAVLKFQNQTTGIINLKLDNYLRNSTISIPMVGKQEHIVKILDKAQSLIDKRKQAIAKLDELVQAVFLDMFGDPKKSSSNTKRVMIGDIAEVKTGGTPSRNVKEYYGGTIPWVKTSEVVNESIVETEEYLTEDGLRNSNCNLLPKGTILVAMYGQGKTRGRVGILAIEGTTNQACAAIIPNELFESNFLFYQLLIRYDEIRELGRGGNQPNLNLVKQFHIILPPKSKQTEFTDIVNKINEAKIQMNKSLQQLESNFQALLQKAFKGELIVKDGVTV